MIELKFKAYHKQYHKIYDVFSFCETYVKFFGDDGNVIKTFRTDFEPLMQYINKVDKNGKEIYDGYIVITDEAGWIAKVEYVDDGFICMDNCGGYSTSCNWYNFEVIGNIYENPELLEKQA